MIVAIKSAKALPSKKTPKTPVIPFKLNFGAAMRKRKNLLYLRFLYLFSKRN